MRTEIVRRAVVLAAFCTATTANAQYDANFEPPLFSGSPAGLTMQGQDAFYVPVGGSVDGRCYPYAGNALGIASNPLGGTQFMACTRSSDAFARTQHDVSLDQGCWSVDFDFNLHFAGQLPANNYAGSFSLQPRPGVGSIVILFYWDDVNNAETFSIRVLGHNADGSVPYLAGRPVPDPGFAGLAANTWHRLAMRVEFRINALSAISVKDISNDGPTSAFIPQEQVPADFEAFYLGGGDQPSGLPASFRIFGGGGVPGDLTPGNTLALLLQIAPSGETDCFPDLDFDRMIDLQDLAYLLAHFGIQVGATYFDGDLDCDGDVDLDDLALTLANFGRTCF